MTRRETIGRFIKISIPDFSAPNAPESRGVLFMAH